MTESFWYNLPRIKSLIIHTGLNVAMPVGLMSLISHLAERPALKDFAIYVVAPWTLIASGVIVWCWIEQGRKGGFRAPPTIKRDVLPIALAWAVGFGILSFAVNSAAAGTLKPLAAFDGGVSAFLAALASGVALSKQAHRARQSGRY